MLSDLFEGNRTFKRPVVDLRGAAGSMRLRVMAAVKGAAAAEAVAATEHSTDEFAGLSFGLSADELDCLSVVVAGSLNTTPSEVAIKCRHAVL